MWDSERKTILALKVFDKIYHWQRFDPSEIFNDWKWDYDTPEVIAFVNTKELYIVGFQVYSTTNYSPFTVKYEWSINRK